MTNNNKMTFVPHTNPIELSTWQLFDAADNSLLNLIGRAWTDVMRETFNKDPPRATLPFMWAEGDDGSDGVGGPQVTDPLTIYVDLPLAYASDMPCIFSITLEDMIDDLIDALCTYSTGKIDDRKVPDKIASRLRELAQKLDDTNPTETNKTEQND